MAKKKTRMYGDRKENIGITEGCPFKCTYCAFEALQKRFGITDEDKSYTPHIHLERLDKKPKSTSGDQFVTIGLNGDISCAPHDVIQKIAEYCSKWQHTTFMLQSKDPKRFLNFKFPANVVLATTIETNRHMIPDEHTDTLIPYNNISQAPLPQERAYAMMLIKDNEKIITIEPILNFDKDVMVAWITEIKPKAVYIGYDSGGHKLPEPSIQKTGELIDALKSITDVRKKLLRHAWWEEQVNIPARQRARHVP